MSDKGRLLSGFQDFLPSAMLTRNRVIETVKSVYSRFGFLPQETPTLEYASLLLGKYGDNQKLVYEFKDRGGRELAMRYDLTVPLGRIIEMYGNSLIFPYRRFQIGMVWRADKPGKGRYREFMQMDADIVGDDSLLSDLEILQMNLEIMNALKVRATIRINSRNILEALLEAGKLEKSDGLKMLRVIDKFDKIGSSGVYSELSDLGFSEDVLALVQSYLAIEGDNAKVLNSLKELLGGSPSFNAGYLRLSSIVDTLSGLADADPNRIKVDPSIARGLDYYTGLVFETVFLDDPAFGSICSGGRYDQMAKRSNGEALPTIGMSIGLDRLFAAMSVAGLVSPVETTTKVFIVNFSDQYLLRYISLAKTLRDAGVSVEISSKATKIGKQLGLANSKGIPFVVLLGENEIDSGKVIIRDMKTGLQNEISAEGLIPFLKAKD